MPDWLATVAGVVLGASAVLVLVRWLYLWYFRKGITL